MKYDNLTLAQFNAITPSLNEQFTSDLDGTANPAGAYTTQLLGYVNPRTGNENECIIKRAITNDTTGDATYTFAYKEGEYSSLTLNKRWSERASLIYQNFKL